MTDTRRPTWCDIDLNALAHNYTAIKSHVGTAEVMPVVKADAYGHGITQVAQRLQQLEAPCLAVAYVEEGNHASKKRNYHPDPRAWGSSRTSNTSIY